MTIDAAMIRFSSLNLGRAPPARYQPDRPGETKTDRGATASAPALWCDAVPAVVVVRRRRGATPSSASSWCDGVPAVVEIGEFILFA
jgi:hypothetical protein